MRTLFSFAVTILFSLSLFAQNQVDLKLNLEKNKIYRAKTTSEQNISMTVMNQQQSSVVKSFSVISMKPVNGDASFIIAEVRFDTIGVNNTMPKMEIASFKPGSITSSNPGEVMNLILNRISKNALNVKLSNAGKVIEISNMKAFSDSILAGIDTLKGQVGKMVQMQAKTMVSEENFKGMIEMITAYLPDKTVKTGDKWNSQIKISAGGLGMQINSNYKLKKITGNQAEIKGETTTEPSSSEPVDMGGALISSDARGLGDVTLLVDTKTGWIVKGSSRTHSQGNMNVKAQGQDMQIPMEVDSNSEVVGLP